MLTDIFIYSFQFTRCFSLEIMCISELLLEPNSPSEAHFKNRFNPKMPVKPPVAVNCFSASFDVATATTFWRAIKLNFECLAELLLTSSLQCRTAELVPFYIHCIIVLHYFSFIKTNYSILQWVIQYGELKIIYLMMPWPTKNIFRFEQPRLLIKCKRFWNVLLEQKKIKKRGSFHRLPRLFTYRREYVCLLTWVIWSKVMHWVLRSKYKDSVSNPCFWSKHEYWISSLNRLRNHCTLFRFWETEKWQRTQ